MCMSMPLSSPTSTWLQAPTTAAETSRPRCTLGGGTPTMQLLSHLCVAAIQWPTAIHRRHQATRPWPLTRCCGHTLSFFHESACGTSAARATSHCFVLCASLGVFLALSFVCLVFGRRPMLLLLLLLEALYSLHALCGDEFGQHVSTCDDFKQGRACTAHHAPSLSSLVITF